MKKILFGVATLGLLGLAGAGVGLKAQNTVEVKAEVPEYVYVDIHDSIWRTWNASLSTEGVIKVHFFDNSKSYTEMPGVLPDSTVETGGVTFGKWAVPSGATKMVVTAWDAKDGGNPADKNQTVDLTIPTSGVNTFRVNTNNAGSKQNGAWTTAFSSESSTMKIYDVDNKYATDPRIQLQGTISYGYPGASMGVEKSLYDGRILSHTYYNVFGNYNKVQFTNAGDYQDADKSGDLTIENGKIYVMRSDKTGGWYTQSAAEAAAAFAYDNMKISSYHKGHLRGDEDGDGSCLTYYGLAKTAYENLNEEQLNCVKTIWPESLDRLEDWATANGDVFDKDVGFSSSGIVLAMQGESNAPFVVTVSTIAIIMSLAIGGVFVARKCRAE